MSKKSIQKVYALTPMQEGMLYHAMLDPHSSSYFTQLELGIHGAFDLEIFEKSVNELIRSYDILRTVFVHQQLQKPRQVVLAERKTKVHYEDISHADENRQKEHIERYKQDVQRQGFNLAKDILFKVAVFRLAADQLYLVWSNHHIMMDGWSMGVLMKSLFQNYEALRAGRTPANGQGKPYSDYIKWLGKQDNEEAESYWSERLAGFEQPSVLPGRLPVKKDEYVNKEYSFTWDETLVARIQQTANLHQVTGPNLFQAVWGIVLSKYNFTDDVIFGTVVSGRPSEINGIETMAGLFINTIPVRVKVERDAAFADIFTAVQQHAVEAERYDYVPLYEIQKRSALDGNLLNHLVAFENYPLDQELENGSMEDRLGFSIKVESAFEQTSFDFNLIVYPGKTWTVKIKYNGAAFDSAFIERTAEHLTRMMEAAVDQPAAFVREYGLVGDEEQRQIVEVFNSTKAELPEGMAVHQVFEEQAKRTPASTAVVYEGTKLTYRELNAAANRLARKLVEHGLQKGETAAIMNDRSVETVVGMLAVLKAGAAYVPLDPALPGDRLRFMAEDSSVRMVLIGNSYTGQAHQLQVPVLTLDIGFEESEAADNLNLPSAPSDLAYIMYTSGSTGKPKGVMIEHKSILRLVKNAGYVPVTEEDRMAQTGAVSFDAGTFEVFGALLNGAALYPVKKETLLDAKQFAAFLREQSITTMWLTSPLFNQLAAKDAGMFGTLRHLIIGGDALVPHIVSKVKQASPSLSLWNGYGPTENTTFSTSFLIDREYGGSIPIGKPIGNSTAYIMDEQQCLQPIGAPGELCVGGIGVARGYVNLPELTEKQFLEDPFRPGERIYRTGDLARWLPDGNIEFLGRIDNQVKVRGFRIELGEIETKLNMAEHVTEAAVIIRKNKADENEICAYFTADREVAVSELRKTLSQSLPDYMVPAHLIQMDSLPLTPNGKINKKELPAPQSEAVQPEYAAPKTESEKKLAEIWEGILGVKAGVTDNFFMIGGHSLKAMMMTAKIQEHFHKEVPIKVLFEKPTIQELALYLEENESKEEQTFEPIRQASYQQHYPVSPAQRRMYILNQLGQANTSYNVPAVLLLEGEVDKDRLENAIQQLINRHEILRTSFDMIDGEVVQTVHKNISFQLEAAKGREEDAEEIIKAFVQPFELNRAPLVRSKLVQLEEKRHLLLIDMHHIITDGSSTGILIGDLAKIYQGADLELPQIHYKDYAVWHKEQTNYQKDEEYWLDVFKGELPILDLPADFERPAERSFAGERVMFGLDKQITAQIKSLMAETDTTMYMFLLAAFNVLLSKYASQDDIIVGSPTAGRTHPDLQGVPGMFVNTVALRTAPAGDKTFAQFLEEVKTASLQAFEHQSYPLEELIEKLPLTRDTSRSPLFSVMFNMQNMEIPSLRLGDLKISSYSMLHHVAKFDLSLEAVEREEDIGLSFDYATALFKDETIRRWSRHFVNIIKAAAANPNVRLSDVDLLSSAETAALLEERHMTQITEATFAALFEKQAQQTPDHSAVKAGGNLLTYRELDEQANQLAHHLRAQGAGNEDIVAIVMDRSAEVMVSILGVMKAGAAFLPIDPDTPEERIRYSLEDSGAKFAVVNERNMTAIGQYEGIIVSLDDGKWRNESKERPSSISGSRNLAYVIYTSGTTGKPKGVQIEHRNLTNYVSWFSEEAGLTENDKTVLLSSYAFDLGYTSMFPVLLGGGELHIVQKETYTAPDEIAHYIKEHGITYIKLTPSLFHTIVNTASFAKDANFESLRLIVLGGEKIIPTDVIAFRKMYGHTEFINHYGPTEATIGAIAGRVDLYEPDAFAKRPTIGRPIANAGALVLNEALKLVPPGASGQLYITGQGLARGYLNRPQLTAERFVENPYSPGSLMYKTGDVVRRLSDGTLAFIGRADDQVKIRGYRIEPKEIETVMLSLSGIQEAVVLAVSEGGLQELCAYYTSDQDIEKAELRYQLSLTLPSHMIPAFFVQVDAIPLTANGKTDRNALPKPNAAQSGGKALAAPETALEESLCRIWQKTLGIEAIGIDDNFFDLGGHSLKGMMLIANIQAELEKSVPLKALFEQPTVRQLAAYMEASAVSGGHQVLKPADKQDMYPLSSAQKRMYVLNQLDRQTISYNMPSVLLMEGELDISRLRDSLNQLVNRHESLRTSFMEANGEPVQRIIEKAEVDLHVFEAKEDEADQKIKEFIRPFDLNDAPLIRAALLRIEAKKHLLLLDMHHIIADGVSRGIFVKELALLYKGEQLPEPTLHYKDFAVWQNEAEQKERMKEHEAYWMSVLSGELPELDLPLDYARPPVQSFKGDTIRFRTGSETAKAVEKLLAETGTTLHMVLHAVFHVFLSKISGQRDIVIGSVTAGRTNADVQDMPGMFVNTLALRMEAKEQQTFAELLELAKQTNLSALEHQEYPFEDLVNQLDLPRDMSRNPLFNVMVTTENPDKEQLTLQNLSISPYEAHQGTSKFDLTLGGFTDENGIGLQLEYATDLFAKETVEKWSEYVLRLLKAVADNPNQPLSSLSLVTETEKQALLEAWKGKALPVPTDKTVHQLFEETVQRHKDCPAVTYNGQSWTYGELNAKANRGYLNREDETAKRFVADPFVPGERMYRTGDLVKWTGGGIEYIGRIDQQVKVRGYRIELSEIEVQLAQLSEVQDAAVTAVKDKGGNTAIAAYVTPESADIEALKSALKETLPDYMIPAFWVTLDELPVTANGKVDRKALPEPDIEAGSGEYKAPTTDMEELLAGIWQDVLGMSEVGVTDNFFSLGGDSIKGIQMASRLNQHGWKLEMKDLFQHPTIEALTQYVERAEGKQADQGPVEGEVILTPIQRWFFEKNFTNKHHWNQSVMLHAKKGFDPERVEKTLQALIEHHDALRMVFREENGDIVQAYQPIGESEVSFEIVDLYGSDEEMLRSQIKILANKLQSSLDLQNGPLLKAEQYRTEAGDHLLIAVHHLVVDGVSWRILLEDFASGYMQAEKEESLVFPQKTNSFKDWAEELAAFSQSAHLLQQAIYWSQIAAEQVSPLPKDCKTEQRIVKDTSSVLCELTEEDTKHLLTDVHQPYGTEINDILLSALGLTMKEWTKGAKIGINLEGHGREDIIPNVNISRTVGWFTAQYPVVLDISDADASAVIKTVKENLRRIPDKGVGYGILRYFTETAETKGFTPEISFNYLGQFDSEVKTDFFEPSAFDMGRQVSGESEALYALSFSGMIRNGRFVLSCSYNEKEFERATIEERMERFKENLLMLIRHCTEKEDKEFTPSDFSAEDLEMDEMGDIFDMLEENLK
ncbi:amino acid adenylation domain-containing protein [Bacillus subtilis]|uniref:surfactin non-ribosomal peptide synthetase SrfAB n=2 Tax=Bacillus subtilis TaxID=1423 RepID=UPI003D1540F7